MKQQKKNPIVDSLACPDSTKTTQSSWDVSSTCKPRKWRAGAIPLSVRPQKPTTSREGDKELLFHRGGSWGGNMLHKGPIFLGARQGLYTSFSNSNSSRSSSSSSSSNSSNRTSSSSSSSSSSRSSSSSSNSSSRSSSRENSVTLVLIAVEAAVAAVAEAAVAALRHYLAVRNTHVTLPYVPLFPVWPFPMCPCSLLTLGYTLQPSR